MGLIIFLVVGLISGAVASYLMGRQQDLLINLLVGIVGAVVGGFLAGLIGLGAYNLIGETIIATLGAICVFASGIGCADGARPEGRDACL